MKIFRIKVLLTMIILGICVSNNYGLKAADLPCDDPYKIATVPHPWGASVPCQVSFQYCCETFNDTIHVSIGAIWVEDISGCSIEQLVEIQYTAYLPYFLAHVLEMCGHPIPSCEDTTAPRDTIILLSVLECHTTLISDNSNPNFDTTGGYGYWPCDMRPIECKHIVTICRREDGDSQFNTTGMPKDIIDPSNVCGHTKQGTPL